MPRYGSQFWKKNPFIKLLPPLCAGIAIQWYAQPVLKAWVFMLGIASAVLFAFFFISFFNRYRYSFISGIVAAFIMISLGGLLAWQKDSRNRNGWVGSVYHKNDIVIATLEEPLVEKTKSYKTRAKLEYLVRDGKKIEVRGKIILYFRKDSTNLVITKLDHGIAVLFRVPLQEIKNSGNPGGFDYKRYALFQGLTHQVFLKPGEFEILTGSEQKLLKKLVFSCRENIVNTLRKNIAGEKEAGLAEALLIGYKNDLDPSLVQSYTNTGVVHIIAISGLHLGLIYWLLLRLLKPLALMRYGNWLRPVFIITILWAFSFVAGAQPSVLRAALMFSFIVIGESLNRKTSIFNSLAISAFVQLCINPYWLWDVGFQLSYAAVLSIVIFMQPIYNLLYVKNKILDLAWKLNAVTLAAQILTLPLSIYYFHQFPSMFLLSNFIAVPLSSIILFGEILLCTVSFIPAMALLCGKLLTVSIWLMNTWIERVEAIPGSVWHSLQISTAQVLLLFVLLVALGVWWIEKSKTAVLITSLSLLGFIAIRSVEMLQRNFQKLVIVYNVPQKRAVDFINGRKYVFMGDKDLQREGFTRNFHLQPSRVLHRVSADPAFENLKVIHNLVSFNNKRFLFLDNEPALVPVSKEEPVDLLLISGKGGKYIKVIAKDLDIRQVIFDGSVPSWKIDQWKKDCDSLQIPWYDVQEKGAFVMTLR